MKNEIEEQLNKEIKDLQEQLRLKKFLASQIKDTEKKDFIETSFGRSYLKMVSTITKPFVLMNKFSETALKDPKAIRMAVLRKQGEKLFQKSRKIPIRTKKGYQLCNQMICVIVELEDLEYPDTQFIQLLRERIEQFRPPRDEKKLQEIQESLKKAVEDLINAS